MRHFHRRTSSPRLSAPTCPDCFLSISLINTFRLSQMTSSTQYTDLSLELLDYTICRSARSRLPSGRSPRSQHLRSHPLSSPIARPEEHSTQHNTSGLFWPNTWVQKKRESSPSSGACNSSRIFSEGGTIGYLSIAVHLIHSDSQDK